MRVALETMDNPFLSEFPGEVLIKGAEEEGKWIVYLQASNEGEDRDGEVMESAALKKAREYFLQYGVLSWDHQHKLTKHPEFIIGEPLDVKFTEDRQTFAKGFLYQENKVAQGVWGNIRSNARRLGASVGGGILKKSNGGKNISEVVWDEIALTHKPVNAGTLGNVSLVPFKAFMKALMAGAGVDASTFSGGRALIGESLQGVEQAGVMWPDRDEQIDIFSTVLKSVLSGRFSTLREVHQHIRARGYDDSVADRLSKYIVLKMPMITRRLT